MFYKSFLDRSILEFDLKSYLYSIHRNTSVSIVTLSILKLESSRIFLLMLFI